MSVESANPTEMNNNFESIFRKFQDHEVRFVIRDDEVWACARDIAACLGIKDYNHQIGKIDSDLKHMDSVHTSTGLKNVTFISEPTIWELTLKSRKPEAKAFKSWLTRECLPEIRRTCTYNVNVNHNVNENNDLVRQKMIEEINEIRKRSEEINKRTLKMAKESLVDSIEVLKGMKQFDERDEINYTDYIRSIDLQMKCNTSSSNANTNINTNTNTNTTLAIEDNPENEECSISKRIQDIFGVQTKRIPRHKMRALEIAVGRGAARKYRNVRNSSPVKCRRFVDGAVRDVRSYRVRDYIDFIDDIILQEIDRLSR